MSKERLKNLPKESLILALEQAISLLQRATIGDEDTSGKEPSKWMGDVYYWLNTWDRDTDE